MRRTRAIALLLLALLFAHWLAFQAHELAPGVITRPLGPCDVYWHSDQRALVLACPGVDLIRVWPLPAVSPWYEDPIYPLVTV